MTKSKATHNSTTASLIDQAIPEVTIGTAKRYQVLIADDEPIIREGIRDCIDWAALGMEVAAEAEDGEEALELVGQLHIDIVLVDMNMPFMDGIELIRRLREDRPECRCLIISGHDEFAYAQEAVRLGVEDYILKPVNADQLHAALLRLRQRMDEEHKRAAYVEQAAGQIERNIPLLRQRFAWNGWKGNTREKTSWNSWRFYGFHRYRLLRSVWYGGLRQRHGRRLCVRMTVSCFFCR